jgi:hypothetical protein
LVETSCQVSFHGCVEHVALNLFRVLASEGVISCSDVVALVDDELRDEYALRNYEKVVTGSGSAEIHDSRYSQFW